jgi:transcriptional regulator with GAF, ATPase, and Fis domain
LEKSGQQCLLADALITHGIVLARLHYAEQSRFTLQRAVEVAHQAGAQNKAGLAALALIEELELPIDALYAAYDRASQWLSKSQSPELLLRLHAAGRKVLSKLRSGASEETQEGQHNKPSDLHEEILNFERKLIRQALAKVNGSVTHAAPLLGITYQGLASAIESRHKDLLKARSPVRRRPTKK